MLHIHWALGSGYTVVNEALGVTSGACFSFCACVGVATQQKRLVMGLSPEDGVGVPNLLLLWSTPFLA